MPPAPALTPDDLSALAEQLAPRMAAAVLDSPQFRLMLREAAMAQAAEQERIRREELPRVFVATAAMFGCHLVVKGGAVWISEKGKPLPVELEKFRDLYHEEICRFLLREPVIHSNGTNGVHQ